MSCPEFCDNPARAEPKTKINNDNCKSSLRLNKSANLPQTGVLTVIARRVEVTTHV